MTRTENKFNILNLARKHGWELEQEQGNIGLLIFTRGGEQVNVYTTKMTVGTCVNHPTKGRTQLFRRNVSERELEKIFNRPRAHTGKGYYFKGRAQGPSTLPPDWYL